MTSAPPPSLLSLCAVYTLGSVQQLPQGNNEMFKVHSQMIQIKFSFLGHHIHNQKQSVTRSRQEFTRVCILQFVFDLHFISWFLAMSHCIVNKSSNKGDDIIIIILFLQEIFIWFAQQLKHFKMYCWHFPFFCLIFPTSTSKVLRSCSSQFL